MMMMMNLLMKLYSVEGKIPKIFAIAYDKCCS